MAQVETPENASVKLSVQPRGAVLGGVGIAMIVFRSHGRNVPIPFGPYLAAAGVLALFFGQSINQTYLGAF